MNQKNIIRDLTHWLEKNLEQPLSLDRVAEKSGYSKWHLQRMFKQVTNEVLATYIRKRRLTKAAIGLLLTSKPILDIALQYRFDSQQTFTRVFKKQFNQTPASFRRAQEANFTGMYPAADVDYPSLPKGEFVKLATVKLKGITHSYECNLDQLFSDQDHFRHEFWSNYIMQLEAVPPILYGIIKTEPLQANEDGQKIFYTCAVEEPYIKDNNQVNDIQIEPGEYIRFDFAGRPDDFADFVLTIYTACLPRLNFTRRKGTDIEIFYTSPNETGEKPTMLRCKYYIPTYH